MSFDYPLTRSIVVLGALRTGINSDQTILGMVAIVGLIYVLFAFIVGRIAANKGNSFLGFFLLALLISPILGLIIALIIHPGPEFSQRDGRPARGIHKRCGGCNEQIRREAVICPYCRTDPDEFEEVREPAPASNMWPYLLVPIVGVALAAWLHKPSAAPLPPPPSGMITQGASPVASPKVILQAASPAATLTPTELRQLQSTARPLRVLVEEVLSFGAIVVPYENVPIYDPSSRSGQGGNVATTSRLGSKTIFLRGLEGVAETQKLTVTAYQDGTMAVNTRTGMRTLEQWVFLRKDDVARR